MKTKFMLVVSIVFLGSYFLNFMGCFGYHLSLFSLLTSWKVNIGNLGFILAFLVAMFGLFKVLSGNMDTHLLMFAGALVLLEGVGLILLGDSPGNELCGTANINLLDIGYWLLMLSAAGMVIGHFARSPE